MTEGKKCFPRLPRNTAYSALHEDSSSLAPPKKQIEKNQAKKKKGNPHPPPKPTKQNKLNPTQQQKPKTKWKTCLLIFWLYSHVYSIKEAMSNVA